MRQRARLLRDAAEARRLLPDTTDEIVDLTGTFVNDLDYYVYDMGRARAMVKAMGRPFGFLPSSHKL